MNKKNLLITGKPGSGKTTLLENILDMVETYKPRGFITKEIRKGATRVGFELVRLDGQRQVLSHVGIDSPHRVGKYGVDLDSFESFLDKLSLFETGTGIIIIDEIGKMECMSGAFQKLVGKALDSSIPFIATIALSGSGFIQKVKARDDVVLIEIKRENRAGAFAEIARKVEEIRKSS